MTWVYIGIALFWFLSVLWITRTTKDEIDLIRFQLLDAIEKRDEFLTQKLGEMDEVFKRVDDACDAVNPRFQDR